MDEVVGWHHGCNGHESKQALGVGEGRGAWHAVARGVVKGRIRLCSSYSIFTFNSSSICMQKKVHAS